MSLTDEQRADFLAAWDATGRKLVEDPRLLPRTLELLKAAGLPRLLNALPAMGVGLAIPAKDVVRQETLLSINELVHWNGLTPATVQGFEIANNRQQLLDQFLKSGFRRLLFLDSDTMLDGRGFWQLMDTMDRLRATAISALVPMRYTGGAETSEYNAYLEMDFQRYIPVTREHLPRTLTPFPVHHCGMACILIDLDQIRAGLQRGPKNEGAREDDFCFRRFAEGPTKHVGEDTYFTGQWLRDHDLDLYVDPKVAAVHVLPQRLAYIPVLNNGLEDR